MTSKKKVSLENLTMYWRKILQVPEFVSHSTVVSGGAANTRELFPALSLDMNKWRYKMHESTKR